MTDCTATHTHAWFIYCPAGTAASPGPASGEQQWWTGGTGLPTPFWHAMMGLARLSRLAVTGGRLNCTVPVCPQEVPLTHAHGGWGCWRCFHLGPGWRRPGGRAAEQAAGLLRHGRVRCGRSGGALLLHCIVLVCRHYAHTKTPSATVVGVHWSIPRRFLAGSACTVMPVHRGAIHCRARCDRRYGPAQPTVLLWCWARTCLICGHLNVQQARACGCGVNCRGESLLTHLIA